MSSTGNIYTTFIFVVLFCDHTANTLRAGKLASAIFVGFLKIK